MKTHEPPTPAAWQSLARNYREAEAALLRIGAALLHARPVAVHDRLSLVRRMAESLKIHVVDHHAPERSGPGDCDDPFRRRPQGPFAERSRYGRPGTKGPRKRPLSRAEWVLVGDDVKHARACLTAIGLGMQSFAGMSECRRWFRLVDRIDRLKCPLDALVGEQHPGWREFARVFHGPASEDDPGLLASIGPDADGRLLEPRPSPRGEREKRQITKTSHTVDNTSMEVKSENKKIK